MSPSRRVVLAALLMAGLVPPAIAQTPPSVRLRGTIATAAGDTLSVTTRAGETIDVELRPDTERGRGRSDPPSMRSRKGTLHRHRRRCRRPNGTLMSAGSADIPRKSMRGTGEGHRPFDLQPGEHDDQRLRRRRQRSRRGGR